MPLKLLLVHRCVARAEDFITDSPGTRRARRCRTASLLWWMFDSDVSSPNKQFCRIRMQGPPL